jgi:hypothetical protein
VVDASRDDDELGVDAPDAPGDGTRAIVELMRKVAFAGLGALFMTEEASARSPVS